MEKKLEAVNKFLLLEEYLSKRMRMSHVYQPVMIMKLLSNQGKAKADEIAFDLVQNDLSQLEYYTERVNQMVGKVLRNNQIVSKDKNEYQLIGFEELTDQERATLIELCSTKINEYKEKRGMQIWDHRRKNRSPIDGSIRYQVLNRANNVCELCGISSEIRALEVDHIVPKNWKGPDELSNFQALCYKCNTNKRDTDDTDFTENLLMEQRLLLIQHQKGLEPTPENLKKQVMCQEILREISTLDETKTEYQGILQEFRSKLILDCEELTKRKNECIAAHNFAEANVLRDNIQQIGEFLAKYSG